MRYLLIDRIIDYQSGQRIRGVKNVAMSEDFLEYHFPRNPVMPGVLLLEAMVQLAGWLQCASTGFTQWVVVETVQKCRFYGFALPGDQVEIAVDVVADITPEDQKIVFKATGTVLGQKKVSAEFSGVIIPLAEIADRDEQQRQFRLMMRDMGL
ncbi:MAG: 3-hydroxyacyl-ACP dehydratase FabZ family protein [Candidatus Magnetobacterium sp. LHC-1]|nr:beta-hydroxyacyl-ACP dehydratase [Nitrospirota bacterium]